MRRTFVDHDLEASFQRCGYVVRQLLDERTIAEVSGIYADLKCDLTQGWHADLFSSNLEYRRLVHERVGPLFRESVLPLLDRYRHTASVFVVKEPATEKSRVPMHQDWTMVDNSRFASVNVVCPLVDTTADNGWLVVVPGSHRPPCRISFGPSDELRFDGDWEGMHRYLQPLALRAGEAVIYDGRLLHGSPPNLTPQRRLAFSAGFIPEEADLCLHYRDPARPGKLEILELPSDFFLTHKLGERPLNARSRGYVHHDNPPLTEAHLSAWTRAAGPC